jgi:hypothetical protein
MGISRKAFIHLIQVMTIIMMNGNLMSSYDDRDGRAKVEKYIQIIQIWEA